MFQQNSFNCWSTKWGELVSFILAVDMHTRYVKKRGTSEPNYLSNIENKSTIANNGKILSNNCIVNIRTVITKLGCKDLAQLEIKILFSSPLFSLKQISVLFVLNQCQLIFRVLAKAVLNHRRLIFFLLLNSKL